MYRQQRNYHNQQRRIFSGAGEYGIPHLKRVEPGLEDCEWISFNQALTYKGDHPEDVIVHFFVDDYQFERVWANPDNYIELFRRFRAITSPDFSLYADFPMALSIYNHFRKHWIGAYFAEHGITVIPTIGWSTEDSFAWCFDGEPMGGLVAVSDIGTRNNRACTRRFYAGFKRMMDYLKPDTVVLYTSTDDLDRFRERGINTDCIVIEKNKHIERFDEMRIRREGDKAWAEEVLEAE